MPNPINIESTDLKQTEDFLSKHYAPVRLEQLGDRSKAYGLTGYFAELPLLNLEWSRTIGRYCVRPVADDDMVILNIMISGTNRYRLRQSEFELRENQAIAYRNSVRVDLSDESNHISLVVPTKTIKRRLSQLMEGRSIQSFNLVSEPVDVASIGKLYPLLANLNAVPIVEIGRTVGKRSNSVSNMIIDSLLVSYPNNYRDALLDSVANVCPKTIRQAIDFIQDNISRTVTNEEIAESCGVSIRSLQYSFRRFMDMSISEYKMDLRLQKAREDLVQRRDLSISEVAHKWGFVTPSGFTQAFKRRFGELPSVVKREGPRDGSF